MSILLRRQDDDQFDPAETTSVLGFTPNTGLAVTYLVVFSLLTIFHLCLTIRSRTWWTILAVNGGVCEVAGWIGRLGGSQNSLGLGFYLTQQVALVIGPVAWSAFCYALMGKMILLVGPQWSRFRPRTFVIFFLVVDFVCLILQGTGGSLCGVAAGTGDQDLLATGQAIYLSGISVQLVNTILFALLTFDYFRRMKNDTRQPVNAAGRPVMKIYVGVMIVNVLIVFRNGFREAELSEGFDGRLATVEPYVACLDALPMAIAFAALAYCHPYFTLNRISRDMAIEAKSEEENEQHKA